MIAVLLAAALSAGPITLQGAWSPRPDVLALLGDGYAQAYRVAGRSQSSCSWFTFAARWDSLTFWPAGQSIALRLKDGRTVRASSLMVMTPRPECAPIILGIVGRMLDPAALERGRTKDGTIGVVLMASYADPRIDRGDVVAIEVQRRGSK